MVVGRRPLPSLRFTRIHLENWRNFSQADAQLQRRVFVVGPNASGKSNFLDAFRFLHDIVSIGGGLEEAVRRRQGMSKLRALSARKYPDVVVRVELGDGNGEAWTYELALGQDNRQRPRIKREIVLNREKKLVDRPNEQDADDPERLTQTYLQQVNVNKDFRPVADAFSAVRYLHIVPQLIREPDRSVGRSNDPYGGDFLEQVAGTSKRVLESRLKAISGALRVAVPQLSELTLVRDSKGAPHLQGRYEHWRPQGAFQNEDQFSDGTLRLLGLLWAIAENGGPLLLEEPELSLHPEVVKVLPQMFARMQRRSGRQILTSTHSTDLLKDDGIGIDEVLVLRPGTEGTEVSTASDFAEVKDLLEGGSTLAEAVLPLTRPQKAEQLVLFGDNA
ncbi:MAG TPA: AAA family ATPase [Vicinamibacterales bacterium]|nr:AAA family ATPase [Vicinamibacterales bacterium]